jgi:hypothetical protein
MEYRKMETVFVRDSNFVVTEELRNPVFAIPKFWRVSEKIDGMNLRVLFSAGGQVEFRGRTDAAQLPGDLVKYLYETFTPEKMSVLWHKEKDGVDTIDPVDIILYGEGYGPGIQKGGGDYGNAKRFRLFDVLVGGKWWLNWANTEDVAYKLNILTAPDMGIMPLEEIVELVRGGFNSFVLDEGAKQRPAEGIVARTTEPLFDGRGNRLIIKLKTRDFMKGQKYS